MKRLLRFVFNAAIVVFLGSVLLLLNITAPNPTHRRYSSQMPLTTRQGSGKAIGDSAEVILSTDLRLPNNNAPEQRQCLCKDAGSRDGKSCNLCLPVSDLQAAFRIPDFIAPDFIAESKNTQNLLYTGREFDQIRDYASAAKQLNRPLWVYVRVDTAVQPDFYNIVHDTGGNVVPYFTVPGYVDPVDDTARKSTALSGAILLCFGVAKLRSRRRRNYAPVLSSPPPTDGSTRKIAHAEDFVLQAKDHAQSQADKEDAWNDL